MTAKTPVQVLQEYLTQRKMTPEYELVYNGVADQDPVYKYKLSIDDKIAIGSGSSKKEAKHDTARRLLAQLGLRMLCDVPVYSPYDDTLKDNAVGALLMFCGERCLDPVYDLLADVGPPHYKLFTIRCKVSSLTTEATARSKKQAKHKCSALMLQKLQDLFSSYECVGHLGYPLHKWHNIFKDEYYPISESLLALAKIDDIEKIEDPETALSKIAEELNGTLVVERMAANSDEVFVFIAVMSSSPPWTWYGIDANEEVARLKAIREGLLFLQGMMK